MLRLWIALALLALITLAGCGSDKTPATSEISTAVEGLEPNSALDDRPPIWQATESANAFGFLLYRRLAERYHNFVFSPYGVAASLGVVMEGAADSTARELALALRYPTRWEQIHQGFAASLRNLPQGDDTLSAGYSMVNGLWGRTGHTFPDPFTAHVSRHYGFDPGLLELSKTREAADILNRWLTSETEIPVKAFQGKELNKKARLLSTSHASVRGHWDKPLLVPRPFPFVDATGDTTMLPMLQTVDAFGGRVLDQGYLAELPYVGNEVSLFLLTPRFQDGLPYLEGYLRPDSLEAWVKGLKGLHVQIRIPPLDLENTLDLSGPLAELGVREAFANADAFPGMGEGAGPLGGVFHHAAFNLGQWGSGVFAEAPHHSPRLSATNSMLFQQVIADRPFVFFVRHRATGALLLLGRVTKPPA